jgi:hypothetical protein
MVRSRPPMKLVLDIWKLIEVYIAVLKKTATTMGAT